MVRLQKRFPCMDSAKQCKFLVVRRLQAKAQTIDSNLSIIRKLLFSCCSGIAFDRDLHTAKISIYFTHKMKLPSHRLQNPPNRLLGKYRRCPAANKNRADYILLCIRKRLNFPDQRICILLLCFLICRSGKEITVRTLTHTKRDVNINFQFSCHRFLRLFFMRFLILAP